MANMRDYGKEYAGFAENLKEVHGDQALAASVGGFFDEKGYLERALLVQYGLEPDTSLIDAGCGPGRLAKQLYGYLRNDCYLGIDVVPAFLEEAHRLCPGFRFEQAPGLEVPVPDNSVDMICAFSLFTHLEHQHTYLYIKDMRRALRPGGLLIFSFLSFGCPAHWPIFLETVQAVGKYSLLTQYTEPVMLSLFAKSLEFEECALHSGDELYIKIDREIQIPPDTVFRDWATLEQSAAVWRKPY